MKAKELMIGDWVHDDVLGFVRVKGVSYLEDIYHNERALIHYGRLQSGYDSTLNPIVLYKEMLIDNGFECVEPFEDTINSCYFKYNGLFILISIFDFNCKGGFSGTWTTRDPYGRSCPRYGVYNCRYVHELQHFLRVAGYTELADNFKVK